MAVRTSLSDVSIEADAMAVCMGWDAFSICRAQEPMNYTIEDVERWFALGVETIKRRRIADALNKGDGE